MRKSLAALQAAGCRFDRLCKQYQRALLGVWRGRVHISHVLDRRQRVLFDAVLCFCHFVWSCDAVVLSQNRTREAVCGSKHTTRGCAAPSTWR